MRSFTIIFVPCAHWLAVRIRDGHRARKLLEIEETRRIDEAHFGRTNVPSQASNSNSYAASEKTGSPSLFLDPAEKAPWCGCLWRKTRRLYLANIGLFASLIR